MQPLLQEIILGNVFAFLLIFTRFGTALMMMPGIGDSFVSGQIRLLFALALSFVVTPALASFLPPIPGNSGVLILLLLAEMTIGLFIGTVMRILVGALDTAGMIVSMQTGFANAMIFNPVTATQGSLMGALFSTLGVTLLLVTNMHHVMLAATVESYRIFPATGAIPDMESVSEVITRAVSAAFLIGVQMAMPFIIAGLLIQFSFGLLGRLMPQVQIFFLAIPLQIWLSLIILSMVLSAAMIFWLNSYGALMAQYLAL